MEDKKKQKLISVIKKIQDGYLDINDIFDEVNDFLELIEKENLLDYIDPFDHNWSDYQNKILLKKIKNNPKYLDKVVSEGNLGDVEIMDGNYFLIADADQLTDIFYTGRDLSDEFLEELISGEMDVYQYFNYSNLTENVYSDVYENLNEKNQSLIIEKIKNLLKDGVLDVTSRTPKLFEKILDEQNSDTGTIEMNEEVIERIINDEESIEYLIEDYFDDLKNDLYGIFENCFLSTLYDEWYSKVMTSMEGYIIDDSKKYSHATKIMGYSQGKQTENIKYRDKYLATNTIKEIILEFLTTFEDSNDTIEYYGSIKQILDYLIYKGIRDRIDVGTFNDYPDHRRLIFCINNTIES